MSKLTKAQDKRLDDRFMGTDFSKPQIAFVKDLISDELARRKKEILTKLITISELDLDDETKQKIDLNKAIKILK